MAAASLAGLGHHEKIEGRGGPLDIVVGNFAKTDFETIGLPVPAGIGVDRKLYAFAAVGDQPTQAIPLELAETVNDGKIDWPKRAQAARAVLKEQGIIEVETN